MRVSVSTFKWFRHRAVDWKFYSHLNPLGIYLKWQIKKCQYIFFAIEYRCSESIRNLKTKLFSLIFFNTKMFSIIQRGKGQNYENQNVENQKELRKPC